MMIGLLLLQNIHLMIFIHVPCSVYSKLKTCTLFYFVSIFGMVIVFVIHNLVLLSSVKIIYVSCNAQSIAHKVNKFFLSPSEGIDRRSFV